jgi:hypothetical protein
MTRRGLRGRTVTRYGSCQSRPPARAASWRICIPTCRCRGACASGWRHVRVGRVLVGDGNYSCERAGCRRWGRSPRARQRLVVRGRDSSCKAVTCWRSHPLVGDLSGKPPTGRRQGVLPVTVFTRIYSPHHTESWPSHCQWCQMTPSRGWLSYHSKGGPNPGPRQYLFHTLIIKTIYPEKFLANTTNYILCLCI